MSMPDLPFRASSESGLQWKGFEKPLSYHRELFPEIIGKSRTVCQILETVSKVAQSDSAVLIQGESGTGKELIAASIHRLSRRASKEFVAINCSAIPEELLESELFGHEKGAFTGADRPRLGLFGRAVGGTIFLDEIGDMPLRLQAKLLRVLQEKQFTRVGGHVVQQADVRIVAATNVDIELAVYEKKFRLDLFYRLNVLPILVPSLRERPEDISDLLEHFLNCSNRSHKLRDDCWLSHDALEALRSHYWPGNVRQLQNLVERLVITKGGGEIRREDLPAEFLSNEGYFQNSFEQRIHAKKSESINACPQSSLEVLPEKGIDLTLHLREIENSLIRQALERTGNNKNKAAQLLKLNRTTLVEKVKKRRLELDGLED
ncbi:MAG: sigma-54 interaction domain-containing protein [Oligoflexales bacterium]